MLMLMLIIIVIIIIVSTFAVSYTNYICFCRTVANYLMWRLFMDNFVDALPVHVRKILASVSFLNLQ